MRNSNKTSPPGQYSIDPVFTKFLKRGFGAEDASVTVAFAKGEELRLRRLGQAGFYLVVDGLLKLEITRRQPRILRLCRPGDLVGYGNWLSPHPEKYRLVGLEAGTIQFWTKAGFEELRKSAPEVNELLIQHLVHTLLQKDERLGALENDRVDERVGDLLLWLARHYGKKTEHGTLIDLPIDRSSLAQLAGTVPATFARALTRLAEERAVRRQGRQILVDIPRLTKRVEG